MRKLALYLTPDPRNIWTTPQWLRNHLGQIDRRQSLVLESNGADRRPTRLVARNPVAALCPFLCCRTNLLHFSAAFLN